VEVGQSLKGGVFGIEGQDKQNVSHRILFRCWAV